MEINSQTYFDVLIVGAGPAGCASAIRLAQLGFTVGLVDSVDEDNLKIGESIPGAILRMLNTLGINRVEDIVQPNEIEPCHVNSSAWGSDDWTFNDGIYNPEGGGWHVLRNRFDAGLRRKAIATSVVYFDGLVGAVTVTDKGFELDFKRKEAHLPVKLSTRFLVDASGRSRVVLRQLNVERTSFEEQMAAFCWVNDPSEDKQTRVKSVKDGWWYSSVLPTNKRVIVFHGMAIQVAHFVKNPSDFLREFDEANLIDTHFSIDHIVEGIHARDASVSRASQISGPNWMALGDAACAMDPITSQGIFHALYTGIRGAEAIAKSFSGDVTAMNNYESQVQRIFETNQSLRMFHYTQELRFTENPYWKQYFTTGIS